MAGRKRKINSPKEAAVVLVAFVSLLIGPRIVEFARQNPLEGAALATIPVGLIVLAVFIKVGRWRRRARALRAIQLADVDRMRGRQFERYVAALLRHHGYKVELTGQPGDQGCDLILSKDGERIACQVKRYAAPVPNGAVQEAVAAIAFYRCHRAIVITNGTFTAGARSLAVANGCELIDREKLGALIADFRENSGWS